MIAKTISHYKILEKLGEGGMGVVYKAEDTKLKRTVALKFLPQHHLGAEEEKTRFIQEAQAAASLNHNNICTIHEIDEFHGQTFIAMEYIEGESLKDKIEVGPLKIDESINIAIQIAEGLQESHEKGIVHRDIKSSNIMVTPKGQVKIMDFGLAKLSGRTQITKSGSTLGTVAYMSPEQTKGKKVDHRTDIWSLGVVLYEMITGQLPFIGDYEQAVIYSIQSENPEPVTELRTGVSMELERIVNKTLAKNPDKRYQNVDEILVDMKKAKKIDEFSKETTKIRKKSNYKYLYWGIFLALFIITSYFIFLLFNKETKPWFSQNIQPEKITSETYDIRGRISPDGKYLAYGEGKDIIIKNIKTDQKIETNIQSKFLSYYPTWSPDSKWIAFFNPPRKILICDKKLATVVKTFSLKQNPVFMAWSPDGLKLVYISMNKYGEFSINLMYLDSSISSIDTLYTRTYTIHEYVGCPAWNPDSRKIALIEQELTRKAHIRIYDIEKETLSDRIFTYDINKFHWLSGGLAWSPDGHYLVCVKYFGKYPELVAIPKDPKKGLDRGEEIPITNIGALGEPFWPTFTNDGNQISFGIEKRIRQIYSMNFDIENCTIDGKPDLIGTYDAISEYPSWSPDGKHIVFVSNIKGYPDLYKYNFDTKESKPLTESVRTELNPQYSPDGNIISYYSDGTIWGFSPNGDANDQTKLTHEKVKISQSYVWSADSKSFFTFMADSTDKSFGELIKIDMYEDTYTKVLDNFSIASDLSLSPTGNKLAIAGYLSSKEKSTIEKIIIIDLKIMEKTELIKRKSLSPRGKISWTVNENYILHDRRTDSGRIYELLPVNGGEPKQLKLNFDKNISSYSIFIDKIDPFSKKILIRIHKTNADMFLLKNDFIN